MIFIVVVILLIVAAIIGVGVLLWSSKSSRTSADAGLQLNDDIRLIRETLINDSHLQRLLMIEIINDTEEETDQISSEAITFMKISSGMTIFGKSMVRSFGVAIAQRIATLMQKRNEIIREYYRAMQSVVCQNGSCVHIVEDSDEKTLDIPIFPPSSEHLDITVITHKKLETITREITDSIAISFQIRDVDSGSSKKRPLVHYQRLYNLITMYDKELINQAKSYAFRHYDISMNCAQSSIEISQHIGEEFHILMRESQLKSGITIPM